MPDLDTPLPDTDVGNASLALLQPTYGGAGPPGFGFSGQGGQAAGGSGLLGPLPAIDTDPFSNAPPSPPTGGGDASSGQAMGAAMLAAAMGAGPQDVDPSLQPYMGVLGMPSTLPLRPGLLGSLDQIRAVAPDAPSDDDSSDEDGESEGGDDDDDDQAGDEAGGLQPGPANAASSSAASGPAAEAGAKTSTPPRALGGLSMQWETGHRPGQEGQASGTVSTGMLPKGKPDPGGVSYGAFQLNSINHGKGGRILPGTVMAFLNSPEGAPWKAQLAGADPTARGGRFGSVWKAIAQKQPQAFFDAQHSFIQRTHYDPVVSAVQHSAKLDLSARSPAVKDVIWSMAVQHGGARKLVSGTVARTMKQVHPDDPAFDKTLIGNLYDDRIKYVKAAPGLMPRYRSERLAALAELGDH